MKLKGRRIHIVGSADPEADPAKLEYVHNLLGKLTTALALESANFVIPFGKEPFLKDRDRGPSIIFDWTVAQKVHDALLSGQAVASNANGRLISTIATSKTDSQIPADRRKVFDELRNKSAISMEVLNPGWTAGAIHRGRLGQLGDILIAVSGGQGVEHLALE